MAQAMNDTNWYVNGDTSFKPVKEVWESYGGSLWFITDTDETGYGFGYARLSHCPQFAEWGVINRPQLEEDSRIWKVKKSNWSNINSYEDGLLVKE